MVCLQDMLCEHQWGGLQRDRCSNTYAREALAVPHRMGQEVCRPWAILRGAFRLQARLLVRDRFLEAGLLAQSFRPEVPFFDIMALGDGHAATVNVVTVAEPRVGIVYAGCFRARMFASST